MAEDKRIRIAADTTPLRQLREEAVSLYREINQTSMQSAQEAEKSISQLREQLALMEDRNELERLLLDLKRQSAAIDATTMQKPSPMPERPIRRQPPTEELPRPEQPTIDPETGSITWDVSPRRKEEIVQPEPRREQQRTDRETDVEEQLPAEEPEERPAPRRRRRRKVQEPIPDVEPTIDEETGTMTWDLTRKPERERVTPIERGTEREEPTTTKETQKELLREINRHVENIDESVTNVDNSKNFQDNSENRTDNSRHTENITEHVVNIEKNTQTITENTTAIREKGNLEVVSEQPNRPLLREDDRIQRRPEITDNGQSEIKFSDEGIIRAITGLGTITSNTGRDVISVLKDLSKGSGEERKGNSVTRYLETIANSISVTEDNVQDILEELRGMSVGGRGGDNTSPSIGGGAGGMGGFGALLGLIPGLGAFRGVGLLKGLLGAGTVLGAVNTAKNVLSERYFRNEAFDYRSQYQGTIETEANRRMVEAANEADKYRWIPFIGSVIARSIEQPAQLMAEKMKETTQKYFEAERRLIPYSQTMGVSAGQSMRQAGREGGYAASALGMDYASYLGRRAELIRAGGGRFVGGNEYDPYAVRETQSVMAAERLFGLSPNAVNRLQGAMRFGDENMGVGASAIIREFEQAMRNLNIPFAEIASTMEESLDTFIKQSDQILSKRGEFRAQELAAMFSAVREETGLRGRQLERVQQAFTGQGMSKNEVVNAMLVRSIQEEMPDKTDYSEIQEELEKTRAGQGNAAVLENFLNRLVETTGGGAEQLRLHMSEVFPNLSWGDINATIKKDSDPAAMVRNLFDLYQKALGRLQETPTEAYDKRAAARTVGTGESMQASDTNKQIGEGAKFLKDIYASIREIIELMKNSKAEGQNLMEDRAQINTNQSDAFPSYKPLIPERIPLVGSTQPDYIKQFEDAVGKALDKKFKEMESKDGMRSRLPQER